MPIYQASALARRAMSIYQTYIEMMNSDIQAAFQVPVNRIEGVNFVCSRMPRVE